jgi:hypothetical protein
MASLSAKVTVISYVPSIQLLMEMQNKARIVKENVSMQLSIRRKILLRFLQDVKARSYTNFSILTKWIMVKLVPEQQS